MIYDANSRGTKKSINPRLRVSLFLEAKREMYNFGKFNLHSDALICAPPPRRALRLVTHSAAIKIPHVARTRQMKKRRSVPAKNVLLHA